MTIKKENQWNLWWLANSFKDKNPLHQSSMAFKFYATDDEKFPWTFFFHLFIYY